MNFLNDTILNNMFADENLSVATLRSLGVLHVTVKCRVCGDPILLISSHGETDSGAIRRNAGRQCCHREQVVSFLALR